MTSNLHKIADEKVDIVSENKKFSELLDSYYKNPKQETRDQLWIIAFRASCNILKGKFGSYWKYDKIEETALDMLNILFRRIDNKERWPNGYRVINLPTILKYLVMSVVYNKSSRKQKDFEENAYSYEQYITFDGRRTE